MNRYYRLTNSSDIQRVRRIGKSVAHPLLVLLYEETPSSEPVCTAVVTGKSLGCAVQRNRVRRVLKEVIRLQASEIRSGIKMVVIARKEITRASYQEVTAAVKSVLIRARLLEVENVR